jgi:dCMP deaminase
MTPKELKYHEMYMDVAARVALMSHAVRKKVGAIMVKDGNILGFGWNGMPAGMDNACEHINSDGDLVTNAETSHAEENLLGKIAKSTTSSEGTTIYLTLSPCLPCAKLMATSGVRVVVYRDIYKDTTGLSFLRALDIDIIKL